MDLAKKLRELVGRKATREATIGAIIRNEITCDQLTEALRCSFADAQEMMRRKRMNEVDGAEFLMVSLRHLQRWKAGDAIPEKYWPRILGIEQEYWNALFAACVTSRQNERGVDSEKGEHDANSEAEEESDIIRPRAQIADNSQQCGKSA